MKYAVVDIGSTSLKMTVARIEENRYEIIEIQKYPLRLLGEHEEVIHEDKYEILMTHLLACKENTQRHQCETVYFATDALRRATNQKEILKSIQEHADIQIEIVPPDKEAQLVLWAHQHLFDLSVGQSMIVDIGGGSMELMELNGRDTVFQTSLGLGAIRIKALFQDKPYTTRSIEDVFFSIQEHLQKHGVPTLRKNARVFISGGNPSAVARMNLMFHQIHFDSLHGESVYVGELHELVKEMKSKTPAWIAKTFGIKEARADLAIPTMVLLGALIDYVDVERYTISKTGIREGEIIRKMKGLPNP